MYKSKLQEMCQKNAWNLPGYETFKDGPGHDLCFKATVNVNGVSFSTPDSSKQLREAQNEAARLAYVHFTDNFISSPQLSSGFGRVNNSNNSSLFSAPPIGEISSPNLQKNQTLQGNRNSSGPSVVSTDVQHMYKSQLQTCAQKRSLGLPEYSCKREGPPHACRFSCTVTVAGQSYESAEFFSTLKEAENVAAKIALMALLPSGVPEDNCLAYKNILQEFTQKEGSPLPTYISKNIGLPHIPTFVSTVEVKGQVFQGEAKTKKQAEMNAAKLAYITLTQRGTSQNTTYLSQEASCPKTNNTVDVPEKVKLNTLTMLNKNVLPQEENMQERDHESACVNHVSVSSKKRESADLKLKDPTEISKKLCVPPSIETTQLPKPSSSLCPVISDLATDLKLKDHPTETNQLSAYKKVSVYPRTATTQHSDGVIVLSNDKWVAIQTGPKETSAN